MSEADWKKFVEIGNAIDKMRGVTRTENAQHALLLVQMLRRTEFLVGSKERFDFYATLLPKIAFYLDGNAIAALDASGSFDENQFHMSFSPKKSGIQSRFTCDVSDGRSQTTRYFIKTHHHYLSTEDNLKELLIYQFLNLNRLGIGPDVHFFVPSNISQTTVCIATKDCHLTLLSHLTKDTVNTKALVQLDLISRILCLCDCTTNSSNCGQLNGKPMIVDFCIKHQSGGYFKSDIYQENTEFNYSELMAEAVGIPQEQRFLIVKGSLEEWNLVEVINETALEMHQMILDIIVTKDKVDDDLERCIRDVKETIRILSESLSAVL
ncbi:hypothetical protein BDR26DRAFT_947644 [Obelidium mucronatum]|nr:hypothetical protein BDR26DRAFT_947644 [Obelidium mucronatum]